MPFRITAAAAVVALVIVAATGCTSPPSPTSTPTPTFTSADQAYAAAERTYRAFIGALNQVDLSEPSTFEPVYSWLTADALRVEKKSLTQMHADSWRVTGETEAALVEPATISGKFDSIQIFVCQDVSAVRISDADGASKVDPGRDDVQTMTVLLTRSPASPTGLLIERFEGRAGEPICE